MDDLEDFFLRPVEGKPDLFAFRHDFGLAGKALEDGTDAPTVTELENGDLIIEGYAASFDGLDRQGENFVEGAFERGIKSFLENQASLCYHHKHDLGIGKVLDLAEHKGKGLWMKARVDKQEPSSPLHYIYSGIKKGTYSGLSVAGFFKRAMKNGRQMIADMDFTEISVTPVPVHPKTKFAVVAGKALDSELTEVTPAEEVTPTEAVESLVALQESLTKFDEVISGFEMTVNPTKDNVADPAVEAA